MSIQITNGYTLSRNIVPSTPYYKFGSPVTLYDFAATGSYSTSTSNVPDLSGNSNDGIFINGSGNGTPTNMTVYTTTSPGYVALQSQLSIKSIGSGTLLNGKQSYTYLMWFKHRSFSQGAYPGIDFGQFEWIINNDVASWRVWHQRNGNYAFLNFNTGGVPVFSTTKYYLWSARYNGSTNIASVDMFMDGTCYTSTVTSSGDIGIADGGPFRVGLRYNNWLQSDINYFAAYSSDIGTAGLQTIYDNTKSRFGY